MTIWNIIPTCNAQHHILSVYQKEVPSQCNEYSYSMFSESSVLVWMPSLTYCRLPASIEYNSLLTWKCKQFLRHFIQQQARGDHYVQMEIPTLNIGSPSHAYSPWVGLISVHYINPPTSIMQPAVYNWLCNKINIDNGCWEQCLCIFLESASFTRVLKARTDKPFAIYRDNPQNNKAFNVIG